MTTDQPSKSPLPAAPGAPAGKKDGTRARPALTRSPPGAKAPDVYLSGAGQSGRGTKSLGQAARKSFPEANDATHAATGAVGKEGGNDSSSVSRRYAAAAAGGAVAGATGAGGTPGAALSAAESIGIEARKGVTETASAVTGGSPHVEPADARLGAGGTSYEGSGMKPAESMGSKVAKDAAVGGAAAATPPAMATAMLMSLYAWLKTIFFAALAMAANMGNLIWAFIVGVVKAVAKAVAAPFIAIGNFVGKAVGAVLGVGTATTLAPAAAVSSGVVTTVTAMAVIGSVLASALSQTALHEGKIDSDLANCAISTRSGSGAGAEVGADTTANAKAVYSVLKSWNMPDVNVAGILGNWSQESGLDPTSVEGIYTEPYRIGPRKKAAWKGDFTHVPGQSHGGIGLGQWSNGRTPMLLDYAKKKKTDWYTIETQLAFMAEGDTPRDMAAFKNMIKTSQGSPRKAAYHFHNKWERSADGPKKMAQRAASAEMWYGKMSGWSVRGSTAGGLVDTVGGGMHAIFGKCSNGGKGGKSNSVSPKDGGMSQEEAQELVDLYNEEGDRFLDARYGPDGGPSPCGSNHNHAMNCTSFATYFVNKYTTFQRYPQGNGIQTAHSIASMTGKQVTSTPSVYAVGSGPGSGPAGHTLVVLGIHGDKLIVGEAGYCAFMGRVSVKNASQMATQGWKWVPMEDDMLPADKIKKS
ncbi:phage tail tip lysozyme [Streptomyces sp. NRRL F-5053]|uniref:phage tail tip lysozyme n=1 Tax=Streptomyces sp. NRRL F-5053 TaxID=1463854 RepID=UPI000A5D9544|nr:phage tail tip lysozyme [Streptomyces sp. NRRL F-5053]